MESWYALIGVFTLPLDQIGPMLAHMPFGFVIMTAAIPIALALVSKSYGQLCAIVAVFGVVIAVILEPTAAPGITAVAAYLGCLVLAFDSFQKWRQARMENVELAELRAEIADIRDAEAQRQIKELDSKYPLKVVTDTAPTLTPKLDASLARSRLDASMSVK